MVDSQFADSMSYGLHIPGIAKRQTIKSRCNQRTDSVGL